MKSVTKKLLKKVSERTFIYDSEEHRVDYIASVKIYSVVTTYKFLWMKYSYDDIECEYILPPRYSDPVSQFEFESNKMIDDVEAILRDEVRKTISLFYLE